MNEKIVITIVGADKVGIVAAVTTKLAQLEINIEDIRQTIMQGCFSMMMLCDISNSKKSFKEAKEEITKAASDFGMETWIQRKEIFDKMHTV